MAIGSVSVEVVPDARGFHKRLQAEFADLKVKVGVNVDTTKARAELDKLATVRRSAKITADADTKLAAAKLDKLAKARSTTIRARVDKSSFGQADQAIGRTGSQMGMLVTAAAALGPALIPATAALAGLAGALTAPLATAGAGVGIFGIISGAALAKATKDAKQIADLQKKATAASDPKAAAEFTKQADALTKSLPKAEQAFLKARGSISDGFDTLLRKSGANIFGPLTAGAQLLGKVLPRLSPITDAFGKAVTGVIDQLSKFSDSRGFQSGINFIATRGVSAFKQFVTIAGNLAVGVGGLIKAFSPLGTTVLSSIERATGAFKRFGEAAGAGKSQGFQNFLDYVKRVGPSVGTTLVDIGKAVGRVVTALAPQGSTVLGVIDILAKTVAKMKPSQIAAVATAVGALGIATGKFSGLKGLSLLVAGLSYAYNHSDAFRTLANDAGKLAGALNNLPDVAKLLGGGALLAGGLKFGGGAGGGKGGLVGKVLGGGIQKVFVVNMGEGLGLPGKSGPGGVPVPGEKPGAAPKGGFLKGLLSLLAIPLPAAGAVGNEVAPKGKDFGGRTLMKTTPKQFEQFGKIAGATAGGFDAASVAIAGYDTKLSNLAKKHPEVALQQVRKAAQQSGVPLSDLNRILPKTVGALGGLKTASGGVGKALRESSIHQKTSMYTLSGLARATAKVGLSSGQTAKALHSLPKTVQTKILTPGALTSRKQVEALGKQFGLTPKQIRTILKLIGARDAQDNTKKTQKGLQKLNQTNAKPHVQPQGTEVADKKIAKNTSGLRTLNTQSAKPHVEVQGADKAVTNANRVKTALDNIPKSRSSTVTLNEIHNKTFRTIYEQQGKKNQVQNRATGGWVRGPGSGTSDSIPTYLSNGEFVVNAAAARQNAALLQAINGRKSTVGSHMATGGSVSTRNADPTGLHIEYSGNVYASDPDALARKQAARDRVAIAAMVRG